MVAPHLSKSGLFRRRTGRPQRVPSLLLLFSLSALLAVLSFQSMQRMWILSPQKQVPIQMISVFTDGRSSINLRHFPKPELLHHFGPMPLSQAQYGKPASMENVEENCVIMQPWQAESYLACNSMHDLDMTHIEFINCGSNRCAFLLDDRYESKKLALKILMWNKEMTKEHYEKNMHDTVAMERLSSSPYVANVYGNCGVSQIVEYSQGGNVHDFVKRARMGDERFRGVSAVTKLKIAYQLATAVADMHSLESNGGVALLAHNDLCCHQFILVDGIFKLNDFHLSVFLLKHPPSGRPCKFHPTYSKDLVKLRAPEEIPHANNPYPTIHVDAVDVFMLGNVLYYIHSYHWLFEGMTNREAMRDNINGILNPIPDVLLNSTDGTVKALTRAITMCWRNDPQQRPSAREISNYLKDRLRLAGVNVEVPVKVIMPPLPSDHRYTDSDFYSNLEEND